MSELEKYLQEVKERADKATEGPWYPKFHDRVTKTKKSDGIDSILHLYGPSSVTIANQYFIAHARTDIPKLLKMVALMDQIIKYTCMNVPESKEWLVGYKETLDMIARGEDER